MSMDILLKEVYLTEGGLLGRLDLPLSLRMSPGQYLMARCQDVLEPLPTPLFKMGALEGPWLGNLPASWLAGMTLQVRGPLGHGFTLPVGCQNLVLASLTGSATRLLPLIQIALNRGIAVTLLADTLPPDLPLEVELLPLADLSQAPVWADVLAIEALPLDVLNLHHLVHQNTPTSRRSDVQVLVHTPLPCGGQAGCGICAVHGRKTDLLACKDGPVFHLSDLAA